MRICYLQRLIVVNEPAAAEGVDRSANLDSS
jgi:hypothetical protein